MKKLLALLLALTLIFTFAACGDGKGGEKSGDSSSNTYETPLKTMMKYENSKRHIEDIDYSIDLYNGFCEEELKELKEILAKGEDYEYELENAKEAFEEALEEDKEEYGDDFKYSYKILSKEELDEDDLDEYKNTLDDTANQLQSLFKMFDEYTSDDWEMLADRLGFDGDKNLAKKYVDVMTNISDKYLSAEVSEGYELEIEIITSGSKLDEDESEEETIVVLKVDGRWVPSYIVNGIIGF